MRKYTLLVLAVALLFAMGMMAQTSSGSSGSSQYPSGSTSSTDQSGTQSGSSQTSSSGTASPKTVEGCVVRQATDYYIYPASGQPEHISSSGQDVSAHLGHHVKAHGTEQPSTSAAAQGTSGSTSASSTAGSSTGGSSTSPSASGGTDFVVDRVDMVATNCPAAIQQSAQSAGMSTSPK